MNDLTCGEGFGKLLTDIAGLRPELYVGGEGRNEVVVSGQYYAQGHAYGSANGADSSMVIKEKMFPVNHILYNGVCRISDITTMLETKLL